MAQLLETVGQVFQIIVGSAGLIFSGIALGNDVRSRKLESRIKITEGHREIWSAFLGDPSLHRVLQDRVDLKLFPITSSENRFVRTILQHMLLTFDARAAGLLGDIGDFDRDVRQFVSRPIPNSSPRRSASSWSRCSDAYLLTKRKAMRSIAHGLLRLKA